MDINQGNINDLFKAWDTQFLDAFKIKDANFESNLGMMTTILQSGTSIEELPFFEQVSGMREWVGPRIAENMASQKLQIKNRTFEKTINLKVNDVEDDRLGWYSKMAATYGSGAALLKNDLVVEALTANSGNGAKWVDGVNFFATTRKYGENTIVNKTTNALTVTSFETALLTMTSYIGHGDKALRVTPTHLFVGPKNRTVGFNILKNQFAYDGTDKVQIQNPNQGIVELVVLQDLAGTYDDYWYLADCSSPIRPIAYSQRQAPTMQQITNPGDSYVMVNDAFLYGIKARGEAALVMPHLIYAGIL